MTMQVNANSERNDSVQLQVTPQVVDIVKLFKRVKPDNVVLKRLQLHRFQQSGLQDSTWTERNAQYYVRIFGQVVNPGEQDNLALKDLVRELGSLGQFKSIEVSEEHEQQFQVVATI